MLRPGQSENVLSSSLHPTGTSKASPQMTTHLSPNLCGRQSTAAITSAGAVSPLRAITRGHHPPLQSRHPGDLETIGVDWGTTSFTQSHPRVRHVSLTKKAYCAFWQFMVAISLVQHTAISPDHIKSFWQVIFSQSRFSHQFRQLNKMSRFPLIESTLQSQTYSAAMV